MSIKAPSILLLDARLYRSIPGKGSGVGFSHLKASARNLTFSPPPLFFVFVFVFQLSFQGGTQFGERSSHPGQVGSEVGRGRRSRRAGVLRHHLLTLRPPLRRRPGNHRQSHPHQQEDGPAEDHGWRGRDSLQEASQVSRKEKTSKTKSHVYSFIRK